MFQKLEMKAWQCKCGHQKDYHPFEPWESTEANGNCWLCNCEGFSPAHIWAWMLYSPAVKFAVVVVILLIFMLMMCHNAILPEDLCEF